MKKKTYNYLCIASYFKGNDFLKACKACGNKVYLITIKDLQHKDWPWEAIDETFYVDMPQDALWDLEEIKNGLAYRMRSLKIDRIVSLDDFDVEKGAHLREHFRIPGMGETTARYFRDKLAMRVKAQNAGIPIPAFTPLFVDAEVNEYADTVSPPWVLKPRGEASATGIQKIHSKAQLWEALHALGDERHRYLLEKFAPGDVYHADAITFDKKIKFCRISKYMDTPFEVAHGGGVFRSLTVPFGSEDDKSLQDLNAKVVKAFGLQHGASHTEFIKDRETGAYYFLETASRVGGANIAEMVEACSGINLWVEWARTEDAELRGEKYKLPKVKKDHAGIIVSLSRFQHPDSSNFLDEEICWRMNKEWHIGLILKSKKQATISTLLDKYVEIIKNEFHASQPAIENRNLL